jgi:membrane-associated phospholipid phosphatase
MVTALWSHHVGVPLRDPDGKIFRGRLASAVVLLAVLSVLEAAWRSWRAGGSWRSLRGAPAAWRERWTYQRGVLAVSGLVAYHAVYVCYRNLKSWDAFNTVRDEQMLRLDRWLFGGHSPAVLLHDLLGTHTSAYVLVAGYRAFTYLVPLSVVGALVLVPRIREGYVFLASAMWVWVLGICSYYLIPTLGPFASAPQEFRSLPDSAITAAQHEYLTERAHLLADRSAPDAFASISAFASLHVGFTAMVLLMAVYYKQTWLSRILAVYLLLVMVATVYLGWHFVTDVVAGLVLAALAVLLGRVTVHPRGRRAGMPAT